ncbi:MAG: carboxypeptidase-like regulatory domain-containing protein [Gemmatimonadaceae bacterium]
MTTSRPARLAFLSLLTFVLNALPVRLGAQSTFLSVIVSSASSNAPVVGADVLVPALGLAALTDSLGRVAFKELKPSLIKVTVRYPGFAPVTKAVMLGLSDSIDVYVSLGNVGFSLDTVRVRGHRDLEYPNEFVSRMRMGLGRFLTQEQLDSAGGEPVADVAARRFTGIRAVWSVDRASLSLRSLRGYYSLGGHGKAVCNVQVYLDGMLATGMDLSGLQSADIAGVEFYSNGPPVQYARAGSACGVMILWTRR